MSKCNVKEMPSYMMVVETIKSLPCFEAKEIIRDSIYNHQVNARRYMRMGMAFEYRLELSIIDGLRSLLRDTKIVGANI